MDLSSSLTALADPTRRRIVDHIRVRPRAVGELAELLPVSQPAVSQHLRVLREAGLVRVEPDGTRRIHHLRREGLEPLRAWVESFWDGALEAFRQSFDDPEPSSPRAGEERTG